MSGAGGQVVGLHPDTLCNRHARHLQHVCSGQLFSFLDQQFFFQTESSKVLRFFDEERVREINCSPYVASIGGNFAICSCFTTVTF
jgi:hypothetical protein